MTIAGAPVSIYVSTYTDFIYTTSPWVAGGRPVDFSSCTAELMFRVLSSDALPALSISTTPSATGSLTFGPSGPLVPAGCIGIDITKAATALLTEPQYEWDLLVTFANGTTIPLVGGTAFVRFTATH